MHPYLLLGAMMVAKKAVVGGLLVAGRRYGWPRVFRRAVEASRAVAPQPHGKRGTTADLLARAMRLPDEAAALWRSPEAVASLQRASAAAAAQPFAKVTHVGPGITLSNVLKTAGALNAADTAKFIDAVASVAGAAAAAAAKRR